MKSKYTLFLTVFLGFLTACSAYTTLPDESQQTNPSAASKGTPGANGANEEDESGAKKREDALKPICSNIGTRSEGWFIQGTLLKFANCADQYAQCDLKGTRSEGWYAYKKDASGKPQRVGLIQFASCSAEN